VTGLAYGIVRENKSRFQVLWHKKAIIEHGSATLQDSGKCSAGPWMQNIKCQGKVVEFLTDAGAIADIAKGSIFMLTCGSCANGVPHSQLLVSYMMYYRDA